MRQKQEPTYSFVILTFVLILVNTALAYVSVKFIPAGAGGISLVYLAVATMILFTLWFGAYGAIAAYVGTLLGGVLTSESFMKRPEIALLWAFSGLIQGIIPLVAVRMFGADLTLENRRDWTIILLFAVLLNNAVGAAWGVFCLSLLGSINFAGAFSAWLVGNIVVTILVVPLALRFGTGRIRKSRLFVKNYWD